MTDSINRERKGGSRVFHRQKQLKPVKTQGAESRAAAALCVSAVEEGKSLTESIPLYTKDLDDRDRAFVQEIVYGTLRHRRLLTNTAAALLNKPINQKFNQARTLILCALYQIVFTRSPAHAVVSATVSACDLVKCRQFTGLVNAVLRRFLREGAQLIHSDDICIECSFPRWLYDELKANYGDKTDEIVRNSNEHAPMFLRVENSKISTDDYLKALEKHEIKAYTNEKSHCTLRLEKPCSIEKLPYFSQGYVAVQDLAAQMAAPLLQLEEGQRVLDCCCAPGGKSAHIMDICRGNVELVCTDADEKRLASAKRNLSRLGYRPQFTVNDASVSLDFTDEPFDRILVDAPCSGTGVIRRHPDIKWLRRRKDIDDIVDTQRKILDNAFAKLKRNGILVYTTCSLLNRENIDQVSDFLKRHKDARLLPFIMGGHEVETYQRVPGEDEADGFFYARFIKE